MNEEVTKARKQNMKIYPLYRAVSLDLIFYYAIEFLFLTQVKNISGADFVLSTSFYAIFMIILQLPASIIIDKIGTRKCTILANIFNAMFVILIMCCQNLGNLIFAQFLSALCFSLKDISDKTLIRCSIPDTKKEGEIFSKLEGQGFRDYFLLHAITSVLSGFLYIVNPYIPMIGALGFTILSIFISLGFQDIEEEKVEEVKIKNREEKKNYWKELIDVIVFIFNSQRLRSLFLHNGIVWGILCLIGTYRSSLLVDMGAPEYIITAIAAIVGVASSIGSKKQIQFHNYFKNKSLSAILLLIVFSILIAGLMGIINISYTISLTIITICFCVINFSKGVNLVLSSRYLGNFASSEILTQIYAVSAISRNLFRAIIGFLGSYLLRITNTANSIIIIGILLLITAMGLISYMKVRLGLKPEEYDENEIYKQ